MIWMNNYSLGVKYQSLTRYIHRIKQLCLILYEDFYLIAGKVAVVLYYGAIILLVIL
jgi:hypothetical protein